MEKYEIISIFWFKKKKKKKKKKLWKEAANMVPWDVYKKNSFI